MWEELVQREKSQYVEDKKDSSYPILHRILVLRGLPRQDLTPSHILFPGIYDWLTYPCNYVLTARNLLNDCEKCSCLTLYFNMKHGIKAAFFFLCRRQLSFYPEMSEFGFEICISFLYWCHVLDLEFILTELFVNECMCKWRYSYASV